MAYPIRIIDRFLGRLGFQNSATSPPRPAAKLLPKMPLPSAAGKSYSLPAGPTLSTLPISPERVREVKTESLIELKKYAEEVTAPIQSFQGKGSAPGGIGILDPTIARGVQEWENQQHSLFAPFKGSGITSTAPVKTFQN